MKRIIQFGIEFENGRIYNISELKKIIEHGYYFNQVSDYRIEIECVGGTMHYRKLMVYEGDSKIDIYNNLIIHNIGGGRSKVKDLDTNHLDVIYPVLKTHKYYSERIEYYDIVYKMIGHKIREEKINKIRNSVK